MLVTSLLHAHHDGDDDGVDGDDDDDDGGDGGDFADDDNDFIKTSIVSVSSVDVGCDFDRKNMLHWLVVWLQVVVALYKNQHRRFVESDAPPVSLQGGAACVGREGQLHQKNCTPGQGCTLVHNSSGYLQCIRIKALQNM